MTGFGGTSSRTDPRPGYAMNLWRCTTKLPRIFVVNGTAQALRPGTIAPAVLCRGESGRVRLPARPQGHISSARPLLHRRDALNRPGRGGAASNHRDSMSVGELFILGFFGKTIPAWLRQFAARYGLGGIILFDYSCQTRHYDNNIESPEQLRGLCHEISALPSSPMVFIDQEGGLVRRLKESRGLKAPP